MRLWKIKRKCVETGCNEMATKTFAALDGLNLPLCDKHYKQFVESTGHHH